MDEIHFHSRLKCIIVTTAIHILVFAVGSHGITYQECLVNTHVANITTCPVPKSNDTVYCVNNALKIIGTCQFLKYFCREHFLHNQTLHVTTCGGGGHHTRPPTTTSLPPSPGQLKLYASIINGIDTRLQNVKNRINTTDTIHIFSKQDHTHKNYTRNSNCWAYDLDLTSLSPWNSNGHNRKAGVLLSPRHLVWARHYNIKVGSTFRFVDKNNNVVERKLLKSRSLPLPSSVHGRSFLHGYDMVVGLLDSDVPSSITFSKVLPRNFTTLNTYHPRVYLPVLSTDFEEKALVDDFAYMRDTMMGLQRPHSSLRLPYYETKIVGDSGNPSFFVIDNQLVFLFVFTFGGAGSGTSVQYHHDNVNHVMKQLGGGYQLTEIDLSKYLSIPEISQVFG